MGRGRRTGEGWRGRRREEGTDGKGRREEMDGEGRKTGAGGGRIGQRDRRGTQKCLKEHQNEMTGER